MSLCHAAYRRCALLALFLAVVLIALPALMSAQSTSSSSSSSGKDYPTEELFVGYQWFNPGGNVPNTSVSPPVAQKLPGIATGAGVAFSYNFNSFGAFEADFGSSRNDSASVSTGLFGPKLTFRSDNVNFFIHGFLGLERLTPADQKSRTGFSAGTGGGIDLKVTKLITFRLFQADYVWAQENYAYEVPITSPSSLRRARYNGARLRTGIVFNIGGGAPEALVSAACSVQNAEVMPGEPVHVTVAASNFNPKHPLTYTWASSGGKIEGKDTGAMIDTNGVAAGDYTATATVTDAKAKKNNTASCTGKFTVKPQNPPQMSCSASPSSVQAGSPVTITCNCSSPDNVPVTVSNWSASSGSLSGSGNSAQLNTSGASPGTITVNATCTDSRGLNTSASTSVTVQNPPPPPPPPPQASKLNECDYPNKVKPWRVDNTCKAALDDVAGKLQQDPDAKLVVVGYADPKEVAHSHHKNLAAERAADVKYYLTQGEAQQHIDASRIECRTGTEAAMKTEQWIVPAGAAFPGAESTTAIDESKVKPIPDHPKPAKKAAKKAQ